MNKEKLKNIIFVFIISFLPQLIVLITSPKILFWDEYAYLDNIKHVLFNTPYFEYYRFPLLWWILTPIAYITSFNIFIMKLLLISIFSISTIFLYKIIEDKNYIINYILIIFYSINGLILIWGSRIYPDILATSFLIISLYFYIKNNKERNTLLSSLFAVLSVLAKYEYGLIYIPYLIFSKNKERIKIIIYSLIFAIPYFLYNIIFYHNPIYIFIQQARVVYEYSIYQSPLVLIYYLLIFSGIYLLSLIQRIKEDKYKVVYFYTIISLIYITFLVKSKDPRYLLMVLPTFIILTKLFIDKLKGFKMPYFILFTISGIISFYYGFIYLLNYNTNLSNTSLNYIYRASIFLDQYKPKVILTNYLWPMVAYYTDSQVYIMYNTTYLLNRVYPQYIIYTPNCGLDYPFNPENYNLSLIYYYIDPSSCSVYIYKVNGYT
ncbi:glycosyl transferase family 39 [Nanobdella aerobiophila]|uniref:Glycosyl transferase family 39 n=1 Tax=Nanobdella aerobiophila TaxID=2586965 RepID=A0A915SEY1_9ARCH|nr:glycosyltransferase family 39 protein [Nanobdella aerobiophila]BBL45330.1 glycosyl transferase family 39 [Nanobdella aerobiophila]